ncbi:MAG: hypothetical protein HQ575_07225 [Candidatus Omnitrophica bacterium]|nr:hypothetical protein [Candidatus Omnitrophota bacterium]
MKTEKVLIFAILIGINAIIWYEVLGVYSSIVMLAIVVVVVFILSRGRRRK